MILKVLPQILFFILKQLKMIINSTVLNVLKTVIGQISL